MGVFAARFKFKHDLESGGFLRGVAWCLSFLARGTNKYLVPRDNRQTGQPWQDGISHVRNRLRIQKNRPDCSERFNELKQEVSF